MQSGRVDFLVLHAHEQTCNSEVIVGEGGFIVEEGV